MSDVILNVTTGNYSQSESVSATASRNVNTFEVLDYDVYDGNYIIIYKKIEVVHNQSSDIVRAGTPYSDSPNGVYIQLYFQNGELPASAITMQTISQDFKSTGTRTVTYKLHYKISGKVFSVTLATFTVSNNLNTQTASGQRIYGVSLQVTDKYMVYSFERHTCKLSGPLGTGAGYSYDSPVNIEDWNTTQLGSSIWTKDKQVVGLINVNDGIGSEIGYLKKKEYDILPAQQYAVGIVESEA